MSVSKAAAESYLTSLISKTLRITTSDTRLFVGEFKCTDAERNIILSRTYEYRLPPPPKIPRLADATGPSSPSHNDDDNDDKDEEEKAEEKKTITQDIPSRYLGLVVIPGSHITKIEVEEFTSQVRDGAGSKYAIPLPVEGVFGGA